MPETGILLKAKTVSFQQLIQISLLCYKEVKFAYNVFVFHKQTTSELKMCYFPPILLFEGGQHAVFSHFLQFRKI